MNIRSWRLEKAKYAAEAFSGEGAFRNGGRWNSIGVPVVYTAESIALASLEILVGGAPLSLLKKYVKISVDFDNSCVQVVKNLPKGWDSYPAIVQTKLIGDAWVKNNSSIVLKVPSSVIKDEFNYVINPLHPDADKKLILGKPAAYTLDPRLIR